MKYLLDSSIIIRSFKATDEMLRERLAACLRGDVVTSVIAYAEVVLGSHAGRAPGPAALAAFTSQIPVLDFDMSAARAYARLPFRRGSYDRLIAAHALSMNLVMVTDNEVDFADVAGLKVENWTLPL